MKVLIAIDSFKGSVSSIDGSKAISDGIREVFQNAEIDIFPLADGGEGTVEALVYGTDGTFVSKEVRGPLGTSVNSQYGVLGNGQTAVIEVAAACGLPLVPQDKRNPLYTTSYGVGELIIDGIEKGCREFIIGLGGSATNDAGVGMLQALGYSFLDENHREIGFGGIELQKIRTIDDSGIHPELKNCNFKIACDVNNPLYGINGAATIFGPQKGATPEIVRELDAGLTHFAKIVLQDLKQDLQHIPGSGAAGGLGAAFAGFLRGDLVSGVDLIVETLEIETQLNGAQFVITGEGKLDGQTSMGKAPLGIAKLASKHGIPVIALAGSTVEATELNELGITSYFSIVNQPMALEDAMNPLTAIENLRSTTKQIFRLIATMQK